MSAAAAPTPTDLREALAERLIAGMTATMETYSVHLGVELGLYRALADLGPAGVGDVAARAGVHERYTGEWLEQQAVAGIVEVDDADREPGERRYHLAAAHAEVLLDADSPFFAAAGPVAMAGIARVLPQLADAYRSGDGVPYAAFGREIRWGIAAFNRPMFLHELGSSWLPGVPEVHERLSAPPAARVLDLGCGTGASSLALAEAYPLTRVVGVDLDEASIAEAGAAAEAAGLADRVVFRRGDAAAVAGDGPYDLVTVFEALHDMGDPVGTLRTTRGLLAPEGSVFVADEKAAERFTAPGDELERFLYGWSVLHCLPATMAERPVEANGTVLRAETVQRWAAQAGFARCADLDIDNPFWRFYRLGT
jgi:2-polyprenyl-3-methyl-5-hydroxy-6-metoxy-1,4-benzoquinol methylase